MSTTSKIYLNERWKIMCNTDIRNEIMNNGLRNWQIAEKLGIHEGNFSRKLRHELPEEDKEKIRAIIKELAQKGA